MHKVIDSLSTCVVGGNPHNGISYQTHISIDSADVYPPEGVDIKHS